MLERILSIDLSLFLFINNLGHPSSLVFLARLLSGAENLGLIWFALAAILIFRQRHHKALILELLIGFIGASFTAQLIVKNIVGRLRPEVVLNDITVYTKVSDYFSFPSNHAATAFAGATILSSIFPQGRPYLYFLAFLIAFSRIYLGVHYPLDVLVGIILGLMVGFIVIKLTKSSKKIKGAISVLTLLFFLLLPQKTYAGTILFIEQNNLSIVNKGQDEQVLGVTTLNISPKTVKVTRAEEGLSVDITKENGEVLGSQTLDEVIVKEDNENIIKIIGEQGRIFITDKLARVATNLPILVKQSTDELLASTSLGDKIISYKPAAVIEKLKKEKIIPQGEIPVKLELKEESAKLVYQITGTQDKKLFGIIPITTQVTTTVSAETGKLDNKISPWFYKLLMQIMLPTVESSLRLKPSSP